MVTLRQTQETAQVLYEPVPPNLRQTQEVAQVLYEPVPPNLRQTQEIVQVLYSEPSGTTHQLVAAITAAANVSAQLTNKNHLIAAVTASANLSVQLTRIPAPGTRLLTASIDVSGQLTGTLKNPPLNADLTSTASVTADLTGVWQLGATLTAEAEVNASMDVKVRFTSSISATGDVTADLRLNTQYLSAGITGTATVVADLNVPWRAGNTLELEQEALPGLVLSRSVEDTLLFTQEVILTFGQRFLSAENTLLFTHSTDVIRVLPTQTAASTLSLTQSILEYRLASSFLVLTHITVAEIVFIEGLASNTLVLTDAAVTTNNIYTFDTSNTLVLTDVAVGLQIQNRSVTSSLNLNDNVFAVTLTSKKYVLLQAPFELIRTSVVIPNPILGDGENLISNLTLRRSMDNTAYTYVKSSKSRRLAYTFTLSRMKALELEAFFNSYNGADIKLLNWKGEVWKVKLVTNPIDFVQTRRSHPGGDRTDVNLEFEGVKLNG
jgi:hypothetical protein